MPKNEKISNNSKYQLGKNLTKSVKCNVTMLLFHEGLAPDISMKQGCCLIVARISLLALLILYLLIVFIIKLINCFTSDKFIPVKQKFK